MSCQGASPLSPLPQATAAAPRTPWPSVVAMPPADHLGSRPRSIIGSVCPAGLRKLASSRVNVAGAIGLDSIS